MPTQEAFYENRIFSVYNTPTYCYRQDNMLTTWKNTLGDAVMVIYEQLSRIPEPERYLRKGMACYLDPYRDKLIPATPEELVRQRILIWLETTLQVPHDVILVEMVLSKYGLNSRDRADIVISRYDEEGMLFPIAIVECKASTVPISSNTIDQCCRYTDALGIDYAFVTNGLEMLAFCYSKADDRYHELSIVPSYAQMLEGSISECKQPMKPERPSIDEMRQERIQQEYMDSFIIGENTAPFMRAHCINLFECLVDTDRIPIRPQGQLFAFERDLGVRVSSYGNAAGYDYVAPYRCFLVKDNSGNHQIVSLGLNDYGNGKTILCVAIDDFKKSHHSLQLLMDSYVVTNGDKLLFTHSGKIAVGHRGSASTKGMTDMVIAKLPHLYRDNRIVLGNVDAGKLMHLDSPDVTELVINLIDYALLRDEYRAEVLG